MIDIPSSFWETEAGAAWLIVLYCAALYTFGLESQVGADKLERFFKLLRLDAQLGVSATVLRQQMNRSFIAAVSAPVRGGRRRPRRVPPWCRWMKPSR